MRTLFRHLGTKDESDETESDSSDSDPENGTTGVSPIASATNRRHRGNATMRIQGVMDKTNKLTGKKLLHVGMALSVGFWSAVFGLPMYAIHVHELVFGVRGAGNLAEELNATIRSDSNDTRVIEANNRSEVLIRKLQIGCPIDAIGKMRNVAEPGERPWVEQWNDKMSPWDMANPEDIWCGLLPGKYLDNWPNIAQLIIFTVFKNRGTTINLAWQGIIGTAMASLNMVVMTAIYPSGARTHTCISTKTGFGPNYVVIWYDRHWKLQQTPLRARAEWWYSQADRGGGLWGKALVTPDGLFDRSWFHDEETRQAFVDHLEARQNEDCVAGTEVQNSNYNELVCFLNVLGVIFLFLISRAGVITMMYGLSWHVCFMMEFMDPQMGALDGSHHAALGNSAICVLITTLVGASFAIIATIVPCLTLSNLRTLYNDALQATKSIIQIWTDSITYLGGDSKNAISYHVERQIDAVSEVCTSVDDHFAGSWWETFDQGKGAQTRLLLQEFTVTAIDIKDMLHVLKGCVLGEDFTGQHSGFMATMTGKMEELKQRTADLMYLSLTAVSDGEINKQEASDITSQVATVKKQQLALLDAFHEASPDVSMDLAEEQTFAFVLSFWSRRITDFAERIIEVDEVKHAHRNILCSIILSLKQGVIATFHPKRMFEHDHLMFAIRNWASISICFFMGYYLSGSVFTRYSPTMASTLSILLGAEGSHGVGSMMFKNTQRMLGVSLGKVLPILISSMMLFFPCNSREKEVVQFFVIWYYITLWVYVYFTSEMWSYVGCLIAGFGVYVLLLPCTGALEDTFEIRYREIGAVTVAIIVQAFVHSLLSTNSPVSLEVNHIRQLCETCQRGFEAFFDNDLPNMQVHAREAAEQLKLCKAIAPECDPKLKVAPIPCDESFKLNLCMNSLSNLEMIISDLNMLIVATKDWVPMQALHGDEGEDSGGVLATTGILELLNNRPAMASIKDDLLTAMAGVTAGLPMMLAGEREEGVLRPAGTVRAARNLDQAAALYDQLKGARGYGGREREELTNDIRVRITVAVRALETAAYHISSIEENLLKESLNLEEL